MEIWLPPEILVRITSYVSDIRDLLSFRLANREWSKAADTELERWACLSLDPGAMDRFEARHKKRDPRKRVTDAVIIVPDRDYWHVRDANDDSLVVADPTSFAFAERLQVILQKKVHLLPNLTRLSFNIRPPRLELAPISAGPVIDRARTMSVQVDALTGLLKRLSDRLVAKRTLKELFIQSLPAHFSLRSVGRRDWNDKAYRIEKIIRKLDLTSLKLGIIGPTVWQPEYIQPPDIPPWSTTFIYDSPNIWLTGATYSLKHLSITCWGFYIKNISGSAFFASSIVLPQLESLELRGCAFTSDRQFEWLLRHRTVTSLILDDCAIVYKLLLRDRNPETEVGNNIDMVIEVGGAMQEYTMTWLQVFNRLLSWTELRNFQFGSSRVRQPGENGPIFESEHHVGPPLGQSTAKFLFGLFPDRYVHLADGTGPCEWLLRPSRAKPGIPAWIVNSDDPDRAALANLLARLNQEVKMDDTSDHAGYVVDLMGKVKPKRFAPKSAKSSSGKGSKTSASKSSRSSSSKQAHSSR